MKAISTVIVTIMLLMITVSLIGVFYIFSSTLASQTTSSGSAQASQLTSQLAMCMQIDNIIGNQITLRNCGKGVIENKSLVVMMGDVKLGASTATIQEGNSSVVNVSGLWQVPFGKHNLKISNGAAVALALVDVQPNGDGLVGSWGFDEGSGSSAYDASGNNNAGTLLPSGSEPVWTSGKFGKGLQFDGVDDYVDAGNAASLNTGSVTIASWVKLTSINSNLNSIVVKGNNEQKNYKLAVDFRYGRNSLWWEIGDGVAGHYHQFLPTLNLNSGIWYLIIGVYDDSSKTLTAYINGVALPGNLVIDSPISNDNSNLFIGKWISNNYYFNGTIDEVRIWSRALAPDDTVVMKQII